MKNRRILFGLLCWIMTVVAQPRVVAAQTGDVGPLVVRPGDILHIRVWPDSSIGGSFPIDEAGRVYLPILGETSAAFEDIETLRARLHLLYAEQMRSPVITITPHFRVSVLGEVLRPGLYYVDPTRNLFDVVSEAGGFTDGANEDKLRILRVSGEVVQLDAERALETGEALNRVVLRSGDRIVVPRSRGITAQTVFLIINSVVLLANLVVK